MVLFGTLLISILSLINAQIQNVVHRDDTLKIPMTENLPVIDSYPNDECWKQVDWQPINQFWIPYAVKMSSEDFSGDYKIVWSEEENLIYFLVKTTDDVFVDGYVFTSDPEISNNYYHYDLIEVFIDEDLSGGPHVFDDENSNAENAFAYHISLMSPEDGKITNDFAACDIAGIFWNDYYIANYASHFNDFAMRKNSTEYYWEFSLGVYNDNYDQTDIEKSRVRLSEGKVMGISLAYCDNDDEDENPKVRDNFIGSVYVDAKASNDHWQDCSGFRKVILTNSK